jgi:hypothetical protein
MVCSILDGSRVRIDVTVGGLLLVLLMGGRGDGVGCALAGGLLGRRKRRRRGRERCRASGGRVARRARDRRLRDLERVHRCWPQKGAVVLSLCSALAKLVLTCHVPPTCLSLPIHNNSTIIVIYPWLLQLCSLRYSVEDVIKFGMRDLISQCK